MGKVYQLPKKSQASCEAPKPIKGSPPSSLYAVVKSGGSFQVVSKSSGLVQYTAAKKDWAIDWVLLNDSSIEQEAA